MVRSALLAVRLLDNAINVDRAENYSGAFVQKHNHKITTWREVRIILAGHRIFMSIGCPNRKWNERDSLKMFPHVGDHTANYIKNLPPCITCSPLNQMSKSRPTQSI